MRYGNDRSDTLLFFPPAVHLLPRNVCKCGTSPGWVWPTEETENGLLGMGMVQTLATCSFDFIQDLQQVQ